MKYRSKIGVLWVLVLVLMAWIQFPLLKHSLFSMVSAFALLVLVPCDLLILDLTFRTYYILDTDCLVIRCGFATHLKIPYEDICTLKETWNPLASSALSLDRIDLVFKAQNGGNGEDEVLISPVRKLEFIQHLLLKNNRIKVLNK